MHDLSPGLVALIAAAAISLGAPVSSFSRTPSPSPVAGLRCSMVAIPGVKLSGRPYFLGRATADTVLAGPGGTHAGSGQGHYGRSADRDIYGQLIAIARTGGEDIPSSTADADTIVVVPWDYDSMCSPVQWSGSARWLPPGPLRFLYSRLRERAHWVGDMPTYDAFQPGTDVFPSFPAEATSLQTGILSGWESSPPVPPESLFAFYEAIPSVPESGEVSPQTLEQLRGWRDRHGSLAHSRPIVDVLRTLAWDATETRARHSAVPMAGTYWVTISIPNTAARTLYLRTADRPGDDGAYFEFGPDDIGPADPLEIASLGFTVPFWIAASERELPGAPSDSGRSKWGWHIAWPDSVRANGEWPAEIDPWEFVGLWIREDAAVEAFDDAREVWRSAAWEAGELPTWHGAFSGSTQAVFRQEVSGGSLPPMVVEAVRISAVTVAQPRRLR